MFLHAKQAADSIMTSVQAGKQNFQTKSYYQKIYIRENM